MKLNKKAIITKIEDAGISKAHIARKLNIKPQRLQYIIDTYEMPKAIQILCGIADILGIDRKEVVIIDD